MADDEDIVEEDSGNLRESCKTSQTGSRVTWTAEEDEILVAALIDQRVNGTQSQSGWKKSVWAACSKALKEAGFMDKAPHKCQPHFNNASTHAL